MVDVVKGWVGGGRSCLVWFGGPISETANWLKRRFSMALNPPLNISGSLPKDLRSGCVSVS